MRKNDARFFILIIFGFIIAMTGIILPPLGVIHNSVLIAVGCFLTVAGGVIGARIVFDFKNLYFYIGNGEQQDREYITEPGEIKSPKKNKQKIDYEDKPEKTETGQTHSARQ